MPPPLPVCRSGLWERHRAAERVRGPGLQQEKVRNHQPGKRSPSELTVLCPGSMFGSIELDSLDPCRVDYVNIKVVTDQGGPFR